MILFLLNYFILSFANPASPLCLFLLICLDSVQVLIFTQVSVSNLRVDLIGVKSSFEEVVRLRLQVDIVFLPLDLLDQTFEVKLDLKLPILVVNLLMLRLSTKMGNVDFSRGGDLAVGSCPRSQITLSILVCYLLF